jgi:hypothetical protein
LSLYLSYCSILFLTLYHAQRERRPLRERTTQSRKTNRWLAAIRAAAGHGCDLPESPYTSFFSIRECLLNESDQTVIGHGFVIDKNKGTKAGVEGKNRRRLSRPRTGHRAANRRIVATLSAAPPNNRRAAFYQEHENTKDACLDSIGTEWQNPPSTRIFFLVHAHGWTIFIFIFLLMAIVAAFGHMQKRQRKNRQTGFQIYRFASRPCMNMAKNEV